MYWYVKYPVCEKILRWSLRYFLRSGQQLKRGTWLIFWDSLSIHSLQNLSLQYVKWLFPVSENTWPISVARSFLWPLVNRRKSTTHILQLTWICSWLGAGSGEVSSNLNRKPWRGIQWDHYTVVQNRSCWITVPILWNFEFVGALLEVLLLWNAIIQCAWKGWDTS